MSADDLRGLEPLVVAHASLLGSVSRSLDVEAGLRDIRLVEVHTGAYVDLMDTLDVEAGLHDLLVRERGAVEPRRRERTNRRDARARNRTDPSHVEENRGDFT